MELILVLLIVQGMMGAFDTLYHHEFKVNLPWQPKARLELIIHAVRNVFYIVVFTVFAWFEVRGVYAWLFALILLLEVMLTLWDFVVEDKSRLLPASERVTHTLLALNYGAVLGLFIPLLHGWSSLSSTIVFVDRGFYSWVLSLFAIGVLVWSIRDGFAARRINRLLKTAVDVSVNIEGGKKSFLVTGGSGFIGSALCQSLIDNGHEVTILTRHPARTAGVFTGKLTLTDSLQSIDDGQSFDVVINLAGASIAEGRWTEQRKQILLESRIGTTQKLLQLLSRLQRKPEIVINASAIGFYGDHAESPCVEDTQHGDGFSSQLCMQWEQQARELSAHCQRLCILRFGVVLGRFGGSLSKMLLPFEFGLGGPMGKGKQWFSWIHMQDLLNLIARCVNDCAMQGVYNATAPEPVTFSDFSCQLGKSLHRPSWLPFPEFMIRLLFGKMGEELFLDSIRVIPQRAQQAGFEFRYPHIDQALDSILKP